MSDKNDAQATHFVCVACHSFALSHISSETKKTNALSSKTFTAKSFEIDVF